MQEMRLLLSHVVRTLDIAVDPTVYIETWKNAGCDWITLQELAPLMVNAKWRQT